MKILSIIFISTLFVGCSITTLSYDNQQLSLSLDGEQIDINAKTIKRQNENYGKLYLSRRVLKLDNNTLVVYEKVRIDDQYELNFSTSQTVGIVFEAERVSRVYAHKGLYLYQLLLKDHKVLNLVVEQFLDQEIVFVYGMRSSQMRELLKDIDATTVRPLVDDVLILGGRDIIKSRWSSQKVHFAPLITPLRMIFGR
jgi:hypothetical protein